MPRPRPLLVLAGLVVLAVSCRRGAPPESSPVPPRRVLLVGLDAADWRVIDPLVAAGKLPTFARLQAAGHTATMVTTPPLLSPIIWTTIATGRPPDEHGVLDFMVDLPSGGQAPVSVTSRRVPALWTIASAQGRRVGVVGWWATWPAERLSGVVVSDRVAPQLIRPDHALSADTISPADQVAVLSPAVVSARAISRDDLSAYAPVTAEQYAAAMHSLDDPQGGLFYRDRVAHLAASVAGSRTYAAMAERILRAGQPDVTAVYDEGIDSVSHLFVRDPHGAQAIEAAYREADALLARLAAAAAPDTWVVVCSDHGFQPPDAGIVEDPADLAGPASAWHRPYGIVAAAEAGTLVSGPPATSPLTHALTATPLDIAPTLLHAVGLPVPSEMSGHVMTALLPAETASRPVRRAPTPSTAPLLGPAGADPAQDEARERLKALGYIGAAPSSLARQNLGEVLYRRGRYDAAERELRAVVEAEPTNLGARLWLAKTLRDAGRPQEAVKAYDAALALPGGAGEALIEGVETALGAGLPDQAAALLAHAHTPPVPPSAVQTARAALAIAAGKAAPAETALRAALAADPTFAPALTRVVDLAGATGRARELRPLVEEAARRAPGSARHQALLGEMRLAAGDAAGAATALTQALSLAPDGAAVRLELARARLMQGRAAEARIVLDPAPPSRERSMLLGAAASSESRWDDAATAYREALAAGEPTPELLAALGFVELKRGRRAEAETLLDRSLQMQPDQPQVRALREGIARGTAR